MIPKDKWLVVATTVKKETIIIFYFYMYMCIIIIINYQSYNSIFYQQAMLNIFTLSSFKMP